LGNPTDETKEGWTTKKQMAEHVERQYARSCPSNRQAADWRESAWSSDDEFGKLFLDELGKEAGGDLLSGWRRSGSSRTSAWTSSRMEALRKQ
jgi:hypothetical protein